MVEREVAELRARVAKLERAVAVLCGKLGVTVPDEPESGVSARVLALVRRGDKVGAIAAHRDETGLGLLEAKRAIEAIE